MIAPADDESGPLASSPAGPCCGQASTPKRRGVFADSVRVLFGNVGTQGIGLLKGFAIAGLLSPAQYGLWRLLLLVWQNGSFLHLGAFAYMNRELPGLIATDKTAVATRMRRTAFWAVLLVTSVAATLLLVLSLVVKLGWSTSQLLALRITAVGLVAQQVYLYQAYILRATSRFGVLSLAAFGNAALGLLFMLVLAPWLGVPGLALGLLMSFAVVAAATSRWVTVERVLLRPRRFACMVAGGAALTALPLMNVLMGSIGQVVCASYLGLEETGFYGLGLMLGTVVYAVPRALGTVLYPRYLASVAVSGDVGAVGGMMRKSLAISSCVTPVVVAGCIVMVEALFRGWFTQYLPGLRATYLLLGMMAFTSFAVVVQDAFLALRRHRLLLLILGVSVVLTAGLALLGLRQVGGLFGVAVGVCVGNTIFGLTALWGALALTRGRGQPRHAGRETLRFVSPCLFMAGVCIGVMQIGSAEGSGVSEVVFWTLVRASIVAITGGALLWINLRTLWRQR